MKIFRLEQPRVLTYADGPEPARPGPGEALVRVHRVGVCGTDLHAYGGTQRFSPTPASWATSSGSRCWRSGRAAPA